MILHPQWREFARLWPEAPAVLSVRDPEDWYESVLGSIHAWTAPVRDVGPAPVAELLAPVWDVDFGGWDRALDRGHAIACFEGHNRKVRAAMRHARLCREAERPLRRCVGESRGPRG
jgi:hypothetical protein